MWFGKGEKEKGNKGPSQMLTGDSGLQVMKMTQFKCLGEWNTGQAQTVALFRNGMEVFCPLYHQRNPGREHKLFAYSYLPWHATQHPHKHSKAASTRNQIKQSSHCYCKTHST